MNLNQLVTALVRFLPAMPVLTLLVVKLMLHPLVLLDPGQLLWLLLLPQLRIWLARRINSERHEFAHVGQLVDKSFLELQLIVDSHLQQLHLTQPHVLLQCLTLALPALFAHAKHFHQQLQPPSQISSELGHQLVSEALNL